LKGETQFFCKMAVAYLNPEHHYTPSLQNWKNIQTQWIWNIPRLMSCSKAWQVWLSRWIMYKRSYVGDASFFYYPSFFYFALPDFRLLSRDTSYSPFTTIYINKTI
jgi:hypothetical protein